MPENLWSLGIGNLLIARRTPDGRLACAMFLVDVFCLGVKDAMWKIVAPAEFNSLRKELDAHGRMEEVTPEHFAKLIHRAADYGQSLGFPPHPDFRHAVRLLAGIDPSQCPTEFEFGQDGRPLYIRGPSGSIDDARFIAARIGQCGGDYTVPSNLSEVPSEAISTLQGDDYRDEDDGHDDEDKPRRRSWLPWR